MTGTESTTPPRIDPPVNDANRHFWTGGAQGELRILRCGSCHYWVHPPEAVCPECGGPLTPVATSGTGRVFTFTVNRHPFNPAVPPPYVIAIVELDDQPGLRFTTNIVNCDPESVTIDMPVRVLFEAVGEAFVPVFEPAEGGAARA